MAAVMSTPTLRLSDTATAPEISALPAQFLELHALMKETVNKQIWICGKSAMFSRKYEALLDEERTMAWTGSFAY